MKVLKKDGRLQDLNPDKIKTSILNSAAETVAIVNDSDVKILVNDVVRVLEDVRGKNGETSSYEIIGVLLDVLRKDGFNTVAQAYLGNVEIEE